MWLYTPPDRRLNGYKISRRVSGGEEYSNTAGGDGSYSFKYMLFIGSIQLFTELS
jgi:hypothetical protein